jgi:DNA-binding MarR family transcriptional regulator
MTGTRQSTRPTSRLTTVEMASRLRLSATRLARQLRRQSDSGLTPSQLSALATVSRAGTMTLGSLAEQERVAPPTITKVVRNLEHKRLVRRSPDEHDRRVWHLSTTPAGERLLEELRVRKTAWLNARIRKLDARQRARLADALDVLEALLEGEP